MIRFGPSLELAPGPVRFLMTQLPYRSWSDSSEPHWSGELQARGSSKLTYSFQLAFSSAETDGGGTTGAREGRGGQAWRGRAELWGKSVTSDGNDGFEFKRCIETFSPPPFFFFFSWQSKVSRLLMLQLQDLLQNKSTVKTVSPSHPSGTGCSSFVHITAQVLMASPL